MAAVYVSNLIINTGSTFSQTLTLESSDDDSACNLTGYTPTSQVRKWAGSETATVDFTCSVPSPATQGKILLSLTATQTKALTAGRHVYDVILTTDAGTVQKVVEGSVLIREGVTR